MSAVEGFLAQHWIVLTTLDLAAMTQVTQPLIPITDICH